MRNSREQARSLIRSSWRAIGFYRPRRDAGATIKVEWRH